MIHYFILFILFIAVLHTLLTNILRCIVNTPVIMRNADRVNPYTICNMHVVFCIDNSHTLPKLNYVKLRNSNDYINNGF